MGLAGCVVMAGGRASRMGGVEKPVLSVCGKTMLERVLEALSGVCRRVVVVYSPLTPRVSTLCKSLEPGVVRCVNGLGSYVKDLNSGLAFSGLPALVAPADMPLLNAGAVESFLDAALGEPADIIGLEARGRGLTGLSLFRRASGSWRSIEVDSCWALDVDTWHDLRRAEELCREGCMGEDPL